MYLSKLTLNVRNRQVQKELANRYELHRTLMRAFPAELSKDERILFRMEQDTHTAQAILLAQSFSMPNYSILPADYLLTNAEVKPFAPALKDGQTLVFRLLANPTRRIIKTGEITENLDKSKRVGLLNEEDQLKWLERKAADSGFRLGNVRSTPQPDVIGYRHQDDERQRITLQAVLFDGVLEVLDTELVQKAIRAGIGSGKGFGFGLLSLARIP